jgi:hypothetical protein
VLVWRIEAPRPRTGLERAHGPRVLRIARATVTGVTATLDGRTFAATRAGGAWQLDGRPARHGEVDAIDALVDTLARVRAVDAFRSENLAQFGLVSPDDSITVTTRRGPRRLLLGRFNSRGSAVYCRRDGDPRVFLLGSGVLSGIERVFWQRDRLDGAS